MTVYRNTDLTKWGTGKGARLTSVEGDTNLWDIVVRLLALEVDAGQIDYGYTVGSDLYFRTTNHHVIGPIALPTAKWNARGEWIPNTQYFVNDTVAQDGTAYLVMIDHTSAAYFDPYATIGINHIYGAILTNPGNVIPAGGTEGQLLAKLTDADYQTTWIDPPQSLPVGGTTGQFLAKNSDTDYDVLWEDTPVSLPVGGSSGAYLVKASGTDYDTSWHYPTIDEITSLSSPIGGDFLIYNDLISDWVNSSRMAIPDIGTSGTISFDPTTVRNNVVTWTPGGDSTLNASSTPNGKTLYFIIKTSGVTSYTITFGTNFRSTGTLATGTAGSKAFVVQFISDGIKFYEVSRTTAMS